MGTPWSSNDQFRVSIICTHRAVIALLEALEREIRELREEAVSTEVDIDTVENEIERLEYEVWANEHLVNLLESRKELEDALDIFHQIVYRVRRNQPQKLKTRLREEIEEELLPKFERGMFAEVNGVSFDSDSDYHFTLHSPTQQFKSSRAEKEAAEATLHSLLFHTAVLKLLAEESNAAPIRMLVIDSPMTNDMDENNRHDVVNLLTKLPDYLSRYQIIISMAESDTTLMRKLEQSPFSLKEFRKSLDNSQTQDKGVENGGESSMGTA